MNRLRENIVINSLDSANVRAGIHPTPNPAVTNPSQLEIGCIRTDISVSTSLRLVGCLVLQMEFARVDEFGLYELWVRNVYGAYGAPTGRILLFLRNVSWNPHGILLAEPMDACHSRTCRSYSCSNALA